MNEQITQVIIVNKNPADLSMQIVIPPFRPISVYELEDSHEDVIKEIKEKIRDTRVADHIVTFIEALHEAITEEDILPVVEFLLKGDITNIDPVHMSNVFAVLNDFIEDINDENRLMH